jgi:two-component system sensor histidine kinase KdpD
LFEKFTRGQSESIKPGVGLGLAICKAVVDAHRGQHQRRQFAGGWRRIHDHLAPQPAPEALE